MYILNQIETPDGTILTSYHVHDYKTYMDKNGEIYMVDGGHFYLKRSVNNIPYIEQSISDDGTFEKRRNLFWGKRLDKDNKPLSSITYIPIKDLNTEHIQNILKNVFGTQYSDYSNYKEYLEEDSLHVIVKKTLIKEYLQRINTSTKL